MTTTSNPTPREDLKIGFAGLGHLGIVSSVCWASLGWRVVGVDRDLETVSALGHGRLPIHETGLPELLQSNRCRIDYSADFESLTECDIVYISLDLETDETNRPLMGGLNQLIDDLVPWLSPGVTLVLMSQVPVGFTRKLGQAIRASRPELEFNLYYWAETLVIGNGVERCLHPERIILGGCSTAVPVDPSLDSILSAFSCPVFRMSYESAELTKAAINACLSVSVSVSNVLADLCEVTGASMREIVPALRSDRRIGQYAYLQPGLGIAGGNLERDLLHLQQLGADNGAETGLIDCILSNNAVRYKWAQRQLDRYVLPGTTEPRVAFWGLAYKKGTESTRNSFAVQLLRELSGNMDLRAYDPVAPLPDDLQAAVTCCDRMEALDGADCLLVLTDWDEFSDADFSVMGEKMRGRVIIDCVGVLDRVAATNSGFRYISVGNTDE